MNHDQRTSALYRMFPDLGTRAAIGPHKARANMLWREISAHTNVYAALIRGLYIARTSPDEPMPSFAPTTTPRMFSYVEANIAEMPARDRRHWRRHVKDWHHRAAEITR